VFLPTTARGRRLQPARRLLILLLCGLLIFYHTYTLHDLFLGESRPTPSGFILLQSALRLAITASLACVVAGFRIALWGMWASIGTLVATQLWAHLTDFPVDFTAGRHPLSYFKGLIFPTIITLATFYPAETGAQESSA